MMKDETLATMRTPAPYWRHTTPSKMLTAIALFASLPKVSGATRAAGPLLRTRHRLVNSISEMPTLPPTRTAVRISLDAKEQKMSNDVPSSADDRGVNDAPLNDDEDALQYSNNDNKSKEHAVGGTTKEDARNLGVVAVSLAAVFSAIIVSILALIWKHKTDKNQEEDLSAEGPVSILRNRDTSVCMNCLCILEKSWRTSKRLTTFSAFVCLLSPAAAKEKFGSSSQMITHR